MSDRKINSYYTKFKGYEDKGKKFSFSIWYGFDDSETPSPIVDYKDDNISAELFILTVDEICKLHKADYLIVKEYCGKSHNASPVNEEKIRLQPESETGIPAIGRPRSMEELDKQFSGFGGFDGYMNAQRVLMKNDYELMVANNEKKEIERRFAELKADRDKLYEENNQLWEKCHELKSEVERLYKYSPDKFNFMGINPIPIAGAILERGIKNIALKHPKTMMSLTGLSEGELAGFISEIKGESTTVPEQHTTQQAPQQVQSGDQAEHNQNLSPEQLMHLEVCTAVFNWLKSLSMGDLKKVHPFFNWIYKGDSAINEENLNKLLEVINQ